MEVSFFLVLGFAIDVAFIADLIFTFFVQIQVQTATGVKRESSLSRTQYPFTLVVMPFDLIGFFLGVAGERAIRLLWMSKVLRLVKPSRLFAMIRVPYSIQHQQQWMLLRFLGFLLLLCHWFACLWNELEVALCTSMVICTGFGWAYVLGQICAIVADINEDGGSHSTLNRGMHHPNLMMDKERLPEQLRQRLRNFFLQNRTLAQHLNNQELLTLEREIGGGQVSFFDDFIRHFEKMERSGMPVQAYHGCIAEVARRLECIAFAQEEHFETAQANPGEGCRGREVLCILSKGLCIINTQLQRKGDVWGEDRSAQQRGATSSPADGPHLSSSPFLLRCIT
eukprot:g17236.t1